MRFRVQTSEHRERKFYRLSGFKGVDYSSSPLEVGAGRATDMENLLLENGGLHKRHGWEQLLYVGGDTIFKYVNGFWLYENSGKRFLIVHSGSRILKIYSNISNKPVVEKFDIDNSYINSLNRSYAVMDDKKLYILCGELFVFGPDEKDKPDYVLRRISEDYACNVPNAYIPVTRQNIYPQGMENPLGEKSEYSPNMLTNWRKNKLVGKSTGAERHYYLDSNADVSDFINGQCSITISKGGETWSETFSLVEDYWKTEVGEIRLYSSGLEIGGIERYGLLIIPQGFNPFPDLIDGIEGADITVLFHVAAQDKQGFWNPPKLMDLGKCTAGIVFGINGKNDRLFLCGHPEYPNICFYSKAGDFTYFPTENQIVCGESGSATKGFCRLGDGTLAVFKDSKNAKDTSVYYITGSVMTIPEDAVGNESFEAYFSVKSGAIGENCLSPYSIANLSGDPLFASDNGVYGITLSSNVSTDERYARERSRTINSKLAQFDLSDSAAIVYKNRYYLSVGKSNGRETGECYVADARYKYSLDDDMDDTYNYEWFRLTNIPARVWNVIDGELWFGTSDGWICKFTDGYSDVYKTKSGEATVSEVPSAPGRYIVTFNEKLHDMISKALYAFDDTGNKWAIKDLTKNSFYVPPDITVSTGEINLYFACPVCAFWYSPIIDFGTSVYRKNLWSVSVSVTPSKHCNISVGYKTRRGMNELIQAEGSETFDFGDLDFQNFSFDCGGFINSFRLPVFERGFVYFQAMYQCVSESDCIVNELAFEYAITTKNIGVG